MNYYTDVLKHYATFSGRATRKQFWMFVLWNAIIELVIAVIEAVLMQGTGVNAFMYILWVYVAATLLPALAVAVRRLRDAGISPWWIFIDLVPFLGAIALIVMLIQPTKGAAPASSFPSSM